MRWQEPGIEMVGTPQPSSANTMGSDNVVSVAKWLVPSIGALAAILGFVAESAHQGLLGIDFGDLGVRAYVWSAAQFLREILSRLATTLVMPHFYAFEFGSSFWLLAISLMFLTFVMLRNRPLFVRRIPSRLRSANLAVCALLVLGAWRLVAFELPAARVENLLGRGASAIENTLVPRRDALWPETTILARAAHLYGLILCERDPAQKVTSLNLGCDRERNYQLDSIKLFLESVTLTVIFLVLIVILWRRVSIATAAVILGPLAFYAALAPSYFYGKFIKQTVYDSALVQLTTAAALMPSLATKGQAKIVNADGGKLLTATVLARDDKLLTLYVNQELPCGKDPATYEWVLWKVAIGQVVLIREIASQDVVAEKIKQRPCPKSPEPL